MTFKDEDTTYGFFMQNFIKILILEFVGFIASVMIAVTFYGSISFGVPTHYVSGILFSLAAFSTIIYCVGIRRRWWHKS